jgi:hypothetical protein
MELRISHTAHELALRFEDESDIPPRFKKGQSKKSSEPKLESNVEKRFNLHVQGWIDTIQSILNNVSDQDQAWRFILNNPKIIESPLESVTKCKDFLDFTDLLTKRRDVDQCSDIELGSLCFLHTAFQKKIEKLINE